MEQLNTLWLSTGLYQLSVGQFVMILVGLVLLFLAIRKNFEPLLLIPIGFGGILANIPVAGLAEPGGLLYLIYEAGLTTGVFPLLIFMGVGAMTDFGPLLANPRTLLLGAAAQFGIFAALLGALAPHYLGLDVSRADAATNRLLGRPAGPHRVYPTSRLRPWLPGAGPAARASRRGPGGCGASRGGLSCWAEAKTKRRAGRGGALERALGGGPACVRCAKKTSSCARMVRSSSPPVPPHPCPF